MPSCDGSNCGACNCACSTTKTVHLEGQERKELESRIAKLEAELKKEKRINRKLMEKLLGEDEKDKDEHER